MFFTKDGKEVHSMSTSVFNDLDTDEVFATFSMSSLDDKIQVNFGQSNFQFNLKAKNNVSGSTVKQSLGILQRFVYRYHPREEYFHLSERFSVESSQRLP